MKFAKQYIKAAQKISRNVKIGVVHPCSDFALLGAVEIKRQQLGIPVLIAPLSKLSKLAKELTVDLSEFEIVDVLHSHMAVEVALKMVNCGDLQILMKGSLHTDELMHGVLDCNYGIKTDKKITHCCVMDIPGYKSPLLVADIAINVLPDLDCKMHIMQNAIDLGIAIGLKGITVAALSADEQVRMQMPSTIDAAALSKMADRGQIINAKVDGPLAFDAAISTIASNIKGIKSDVAGHANVLIVPNIEAGNILVKQLKYFAEAIMPGIVLGAKVPIVLTSRADDGITRAASTALAILYAAWHQKQLGTVL